MNLTWDAVTGVVVGIISIISSLAIGVRWLVKHYFDDIKHELKPNSGQSIKDQVNRMELDINLLKDQNIKGEEFHEKIDQKIDKLTEFFLDYMSRQK